MEFAAIKQIEYRLQVDDNADMSEDLIPIKYQVPHYSGRLWRGFQQYINKYINPDIFQKICKQLGMNPDYLLKDENWASEEFFEDFMKLFREYNNDPDFCRKVGRFSVSPDAANPIEFALYSSFPIPALFYFSIAQVHRRYSLKNNMVISRFSLGLFIFKMTPKDGRPSSLEVCNNTIGMLEGTDQLPLDRLSVSHEKCIHKGFSACEFKVEYSTRKIWLRRSFYLSLYGLGVYLLSVWTDHFGSANSDLAHSWFKVSVYGWTLMSLSTWFISKYFYVYRYISQYHDQMTNRVRELFEEKKKADERFQETNLINNLLRKLTISNETKDILKSCLDELKNRFGYSRCFVMLVSADQKSLFTAEVSEFGEVAKKLYELTLVYPAEGDDQFFFARILENGKTEAILDIESYLLKVKPHIKKLIQFLSVTSTIVAPIQDQNNKYGILVVGSIRNDRKLTEVDKVRVENVAQALSAVFKNARAFEAERRSRQILEYTSPAITKLAFDRMFQDLGEFRPKWAYTTLFSVDMRGFTKLLNEIAPDRSITMVNIYMKHIHDRIIQSGGIIDRLNGDQAVAFWYGGEQDHDSHAKYALLASIKILAEVSELDHKLEDNGFKPISFGIGLYSGRALFGLIGTEHKMDFCPTGSPMAITARIEGLCKDFTNKTASAQRAVLLVSDTTFKKANLSIPAIELGYQALRGREEGELLHFLDPKICKKWFDSNQDSFSSFSASVSSTATDSSTNDKGSRAA